MGEASTLELGWHPVTFVTMFETLLQILTCTMHLDTLQVHVQVRLCQQAQSLCGKLVMFLILNFYKQKHTILSLFGRSTVNKSNLLENQCSSHYRNS